jgi:hypothetical protein
VARGAVLAGLVAFFICASAQTFDQPRPRGAEIAAEHAAPPRGPTPPFGSPAAAPRRRGCPRETLVRFSAFEAWLRELPLGWLLADAAAARLIGSCSPAL